MALADLMHLARTHGIDFEDRLRVASNHFNEELLEETGS